MIITSQMLEVVLKAIIAVAPDVVALIKSQIGSDESLKRSEIEYLIGRLEKHQLPKWKQL